MNRAIVMVLPLILCGCQTAVERIAYEHLFVHTKPAGAMASLSDGTACETPCALKLPRKWRAVIRLSKAGCEEAAVTVKPILDSGMWIPAWLDFESGAAFSLKPNPVEVSLKCSGG